MRPKSLLKGIQTTLTGQQVQEDHQQQRHCPHCHRERRVKERRPLRYRSLFGKLTLEGERLFRCDCQAHESKSFNPLAELLAERNAPELLYLESKFSALMSYGLSVKLLSEVLPVDQHLSPATVRSRTHRVAERLEAELGEERFTFIDGCPAEWEKLPKPDMPLTVGIDGGYVHSCESKSEGKNPTRWFEVITGKSIADDGSSKCFGLVNGYDSKPKRRVFEVLQSQGMQMNQQVTFLSDGGDTVRNLLLYLNPEAEHLLDCFHITMRVTVMNQMAKGIINPADNDGLKDEVLTTLESMKWYLWHGNVCRALQESEHLEFILDAESAPPAQLKLQKKATEFHTYITNNQNFIPNYGERYRNGERIATGFVESTVNQVISKRMVKKQQMRWSKRGAHLLLQVRTKVLDQEWRETFERWYPGLNPQLQDALPLA